MRYIPFALAMSLLLTMFANAVASPFTDIPTDSAQTAAISWALDAGITTASSETAFSPEEPCTRGQVVTFLWRAMGQPTPSQTALPFDDVSSDSPYATAIAWAVETGVASGFSDTIFAPDTSCSTAQVLTFVHRSQGLPTGESTLSALYPDTYFTDALAWADSMGLLCVLSDGLNPDALASRGQVVGYLYQLSLSCETTPATPSLDLIFPADQNEVTLPFILALQDQGVDVAGSLYGALPGNLSAGSQLVCYHDTLYFFRNDSQTISATLPDGSAAIWDLYASEGTLSHMQIYGDKLYFLEKDLSSQQTTLCAMNLDGSERTVVLDTSGQIGDYTLLHESCFLYDGRFYFLATSDTTTNTIVSYDLTMGDEQVLYVHTQRIYTGDGLSLGIANGRIYFCQIRTFGRQGDGYSIDLTGGDLQFASPEELLGTGIGADMVGTSNGKTTVLVSCAGVISYAPVSLADGSSLTDVYIDGTYAFTANIDFNGVNIVSPTQFFAQGILFSIDGSCADLSIPDTGSRLSVLSQQVLVNRSDYL